MQKLLIISGLAVLALGLLWPWLVRLPLDHLPGDILIEREGVRLYFPLVTGILLSLVASLVFWLFRN